MCTERRELANCVQNMTMVTRELGTADASCAHMTATRLGQGPNGVRIQAPISSVVVSSAHSLHCKQNSIEQSTQVSTLSQLMYSSVSAEYALLVHQMQCSSTFRHTEAI